MKKFSLILAIIMLFASINVFAALPEDTVSPQANCMNHNYTKLIYWDFENDKHTYRCGNGDCDSTMTEDCVPSSQFCGDADPTFDVLYCFKCGYTPFNPNHNYQYEHYVDYSTSPSTHMHVQVCNNLNPYGMAIPCGREKESTRCECSNVRQVWSIYTVDTGHIVVDRCPTCGYEHNFVGYLNPFENHASSYDSNCGYCRANGEYVDY